MSIIMLIFPDHPYHMVHGDHHGCVGGFDNPNYIAFSSGWNNTASPVRLVSTHYSSIA